MPIKQAHIEALRINALIGPRRAGTVYSTSPRGEHSEVLSVKVFTNGPFTDFVIAERTIGEHHVRTHATQWSINRFATIHSA